MIWGCRHCGNTYEGSYIKGFNDKCPHCGLLQSKSHKEQVVEKLSIKKHKEKGGETDNHEKVVQCLSASLTVIVQQGILKQEDIEKTLKEKGYEGLFEILDDVYLKTNNIEIHLE